MRTGGRPNTTRASRTDPANPEPPRPLRGNPMPHAAETSSLVSGPSARAVWRAQRDRLRKGSNRHAPGLPIWSGRLAGADMRSIDAAMTTTPKRDP